MSETEKGHTIVGKRIPVRVVTALAGDKFELVDREMQVKYVQKRNAKCMCGSGKKFKKCCYGKVVE